MRQIIKCTVHVLVVYLLYMYSCTYTSNVVLVYVSALRSPTSIL